MPPAMPPAFVRNVDNAPTAWVGWSSVAGVAEALPMRMGSRAAQALLEGVGLVPQAQAAVPTRVADAELRALHQALRDTLGLPEARAVARDAGTRAADQLMARHLPPGLQVLLRRLPAGLALRLLWRALQPHVWTFAGDGQVTLQPGRPWVLRIRGNPLCRGVQAAEPGCDFVAALLERLLRVLVHARCTVVETECEACGAPACRFELRW